MTRDELIAALQAMPKNLPVYYLDHEDGEVCVETIVCETIQVLDDQLYVRWINGDKTVTYEVDTEAIVIK